MSERDDHKRTGPTMAQGAIEAALGGFSSPFDNWTDEDWARHEARLEKPRTATVTPIRKEPDLSSRGWPERAIRAAKVADVSRESIAGLLSVDWEDKSIVILSGDSGCGKTVAACYWALQATKQSRFCHFVRASTFAASSRYDHATRDQWYRAHALVLDDLGAEYLDAKGSFLVDLDELIDTFYGAMRALVITTNLTLEQFRERYSERVYDRIRECGIWLDVAAASMRGKGKTP